MGEVLEPQQEVVISVVARQAKMSAADRDHWGSQSATTDRTRVGCCAHSPLLHDSFLDFTRNHFTMLDHQIHALKVSFWPPGESSHSDTTNIVFTTVSHPLASFLHPHHYGRIAR